MKRPNPLSSPNSTELLSISSISTSKMGGKRISFIDTTTKKPLPKSLDPKKVIFISVCFFVFFVSSLLHFILFASYSATRSSLQQATLEQRRRSIDEQAVVAHRLYQLADFACEIANQPGQCTPQKAPLSLESFFGGGSKTYTTAKMKNDLTKEQQQQQQQMTTQHFSVIVNVAYRQEKIEIINLVVVKLKN